MVSVTKGFVYILEVMLSNEDNVNAYIFTFLYPKCPQPLFLLVCVSVSVAVRILYMASTTNDE